MVPPHWSVGQVVSRGHLSSCGHTSVEIDKKTKEIPKLSTVRLKKKKGISK